MIYLFNDGIRWIADFTKSVRCDEVIELFDNLQIPTIWEAATPLTVVKKNIQDLNPEEIVF